MEICLVQYSPVWESIDENIAKLNLMFNEFDDKVDLIVFPELTLTGFTMNSKMFAEEIDGKCTEFFISLSSKMKTNVIGGLIELDERNIYNSAVHFQNGIIMARYRKIHPFSLAGEDKYFSDSRETVITKVGNMQVGLSICYDLRFPELYRKYAKKRVDMIIDIANWPITRIDHWKTLLKARAIENLCYAVGVNRTGDDPNVKYNGCSAVFDPAGQEIICEKNSEELIIVELEDNLAKEVKSKFHFLEDIRLI